MLFSAGWRPFAALCSEQSRFSYCRKKVAFSTAFKGKGVVSGPSRSNSTSFEEGSETLLPSFLPSFNNTVPFSASRSLTRSSSSSNNTYPGPGGGPR